MGKTENNENQKHQPKILVVDDEDQFRQPLARQLSVRGYHVLEAAGGMDTIKIVRHERPEVVVLDQKMPGMDGIQTLREITKIRPEVQVIMLTGFGSTQIATTTGRHGAFYFLEKPCDLEELIRVIEMARQERVFALSRHEILDISSPSLKDRLLGTHNHRPGVILLGVLLFAAIAYMPTPPSLASLLSLKKTGQTGEVVEGHAAYRKMTPGQTIADYYSRKEGVLQKAKGADGQTVETPLTVEQVAFRAKVTVGILVISVLFWATSALPVGIVAMLTGVILYFFDVLPIESVAKSFAKDSVIFIFGILAVAAALGKTGLDRRIALVLLGTSTSLARFMFIFAPSLAVAAAFLSEHALCAFLAPILLLIYVAAIRSAGLKKDRQLLVMLFLLLTFSANVGGPGSPAAGGRNAVMLGILADYGVSVSFGQWMLMGLPFVPVMAIVIAAYFYFMFRGKTQVKNLNLAAEVRKESGKIGKMTLDEYKAAGCLLLLIGLWCTASGRLGMGGPVLLCLVLLNVLGILRWRDINTIHWDVVALYAAAGAMGGALASTGAALWLASSFLNLLPDFFRHGMGICVSSSLITGFLTNFMSDGATVAAVGPITVPMATLSGMSAIQVGLATAFSSSFANMFIVGTPNNAICYSVAKDPETGEQLLTMKDFLIHGSVILILNWLVLWVWVFWGYWRWIPV
jgi:sodium-dependent dicarboxylate transporter 2/3/5